jgi:hypothetical protein
MCSTKWETLENFLDDKSLEINAYQADFENLEMSIFFFTHKKDNCFSTLAIEAEKFISLYSGRKYAGRRTGEKECPKYCLDIDQLNRCDAFCECAFNREIIQMIKERHKK